MNILIDGDIYSRTYFGGSVRYCNQLVKGLCSKGICVDLLLTDQSVKPIDVDSMQFRVINTIDRSVKYDIFHGSYYSDFTRTEFERKVVTVHDLINELLPEKLTACGSLCGSFKKCVNKKEQAITCADAIIAISNTTRNDLTRFYDISSEKVHVIYHGIEEIFISKGQDYFKKSLKEKFLFDRPYILHVGGREGYKNFVFLLEAFGRSRVKEEAFMLVVGSQSHFMPEEEEIIIKYNLQKKVILTGYVSDELLKIIYLNTRLMVMPSLYEGFGYPLLEALACGTTVACSSAPALVEIGQGIPLVFNENDVFSCINILEIGFYEDHRQRNIMGRELASSFTIEKMIKSYIELYVDLKRSNVFNGKLLNSN